MAMAGDGVKSTHPPLAAADVGLAMGSGTDVAIESAGITLLKGDLTGIVRARKLSQATMSNIRQNLVKFAFMYNVAGASPSPPESSTPPSTSCFPMIAAAAMALSSVSVIATPYGCAPVAPERPHSHEQRARSVLPAEVRISAPRPGDP